MAKVAVVVTVLNESETIGVLLGALRRQTTRPAEVVIVDGGSVDGTWEVLRKTRGIKAYRQLGNRSVGRNFGVTKTTSPIIAFTDAGCIPQPNWLEELVKPFTDSNVAVVSGYYKGLSNSVFEKCLVPYVLVMPDQIRGEFFPSTRSMAMRKGVGLFDAKLSHNEDHAFAIALKKRGLEFYFAPKAVVGWQPRKNLREAAWMFMRFAIGDAQAGILRPKVKLLALRYYLFFFLVFLSSWAWVLLIPYLIWAVGKNYKYVRDIQALFWLPVLQVISDIMVLFGTLVGLLSRA